VKAQRLHDVPAPKRCELCGSDLSEPADHPDAGRAVAAYVLRYICDDFVSGLVVLRRIACPRETLQACGDFVRWVVVSARKHTGRFSRQGINGILASAEGKHPELRGLLRGTP